MFNVSHGALFTTGDVAKLTGVSPRTVTGWTDDKMLECFIVPGSRNHRRIHRRDLAPFLKRHNMLQALCDLEGSDPRRLLVLGVGDNSQRVWQEALATWQLTFVDSAFDLGLTFHACPAAAVLIDLGGASGEWPWVARGLHQRGFVNIFGMVPEDKQVADYAKHGWFRGLCAAGAFTPLGGSLEEMLKEQDLEKRRRG